MTPRTPAVVVRESPEQAWAALAGAWRASAAAALAEGGWFAAALSGGRTPEGFYRLLAREPGLPWERTHLFLTDERLVPAGDPESNARLVRASLLEALPRPPAGVHAPRTDLADADAAADDYERRLREALVAIGRPRPALDLVLLGVGADGHVASLFPGAAALAERSRLVVGVPAEQGRRARVTLTLGAINAAARVIVLATGAAKRPALVRVLRGERELPAALVDPAGGPAEFFLDRAAWPGSDEAAAGQAKAGERTPR